MADSPSAPPTPPGDATEPPRRERRQNHALRELIDEMMASIRSATHGDLWTPEERTQYERELAGIMSRVRSTAVVPPGEPTG